MVYKIYKAKVTSGGYFPEGNCKGTLTLDADRNPTWTDLAQDFEQIGLPWFSNSIRMGVIDDLEPLTPYSAEAIEHLSKHQLPSVGFVMVPIKEESASSSPVQKMPLGPPPIFGYNQPPPGLFKKK